MVGSLLDSVNCAIASPVPTANRMASSGFGRFSVADPATTTSNLFVYLAKIPPSQIYSGRGIRVVLNLKTMAASGGGTAVLSCTLKQLANSQTVDPTSGATNPLYRIVQVPPSSLANFQCSFDFPATGNDSIVAGDWILVTFQRLGADGGDSSADWIALVDFQLYEV